MNIHVARLGCTARFPSSRAPVPLILLSEENPSFSNETYHYSWFHYGAIRRIDKSSISSGIY